MQQPDRSSINKSTHLDSTHQILISIFVTAWNWVQNFVTTIFSLLTPKVVHVEISLEDRLSDAIAQAVRDPEFRIQLLDRPKPALASLDIIIPPQQEVTVLESTSTQTFLVLPIMTDREVEQLQAGVNSPRPLRSVRSRILLKIWQDPDYRSQIFADPKAVLIAEGFPIPDTAAVKILENSLTHLYLAIPSMH
jgi:hypothetical protein